MNTLIDILRQYAEKQPEKLFAADINGCITYEQAWKNAVNVASRLKNDFRINRGDRVLIQCNQSIEYLSVYLGCILHGAIFVPVEDNVSNERIRKIADEVECRLFININGKKPATTKASNGISTSVSGAVASIAASASALTACSCISPVLPTSVIPSHIHVPSVT